MMRWKAFGPCETLDSSLASGGGRRLIGGGVGSGGV